MKRWMCGLAALILLLGLAAASGAAESAYATLKLGDKGEAVLALKQRMYELGYFTSTKFSTEFNATTKERLIELQKKNGLTADGVATPEVQALIFSDACLPKSAPDPTAAPVAAPETDDNGFLPAGEEAFSYADRASGVWTYISQTLHIEIRQHTASGPLIWLEAVVRMKDASQLTSLLSTGKKPGTNLVLPSKIMSDLGQPVLAFNDDFFGYRVRYGGKVGVIVRDGQILYNDPKISSSGVFPPLDILAVFQDGTIKTYESDAYTAQQYVDMGVKDTYAFGPILVREGKIDPDSSRWGTKRSPRLAMGVREDGAIVVVDVLGRRKDAIGVTIEWMAQKMYELGCVEALNMDGGNTTCMIFQGDMINRPVNTASKDIRRITGLIGVKEGN
ncbi:MAG: phosphodiester glycosidase family protein [Clostridia bacterium]|nr:phosphodiester glycosidase family protein [Clostridia bacterium]